MAWSLAPFTAPGKQGNLMRNVIILILAAPETQEGLGQLYHALETAQDLQNHGVPVSIYFEGSGIRWLPELLDPGSNLHPLYRQVANSVRGACAFCARAYGLEEKLKEIAFPLISEHDGHPSVARMILNNASILVY